jgi:hypothetical protein
LWQEEVEREEGDNSHDIENDENMADIQNQSNVSKAAVKKETETLDSSKGSDATMDIEAMLKESEQMQKELVSDFLLHDIMLLIPTLY